MISHFPESAKLLTTPALLKSANPSNRYHPYGCSFAHWEDHHAALVTTGNNGGIKYLGSIRLRAF
jgi:hypothetical protein